MPHIFPRCELTPFRASPKAVSITGVPLESTPNTSVDTNLAELPVYDGCHPPCAIARNISPISLILEPPWHGRFTVSIPVCGKLNMIDSIIRQHIPRYLLRTIKFGGLVIQLDLTREGCSLSDFVVFFLQLARTSRLLSRNISVYNICFDLILQHVHGARGCH